MSTRSINYKLTTPCDQCPFLKGSGFTWKSLTEHADGEFPCHKACDVDEESSTYIPKVGQKTPHCAGALIFLEKLGRPHQMMRISERLGFYDRHKLNMSAPVVASPSECRPDRAGTKPQPLTAESLFEYASAFTESSGAPPTFREVRTHFRTTYDDIEQAIDDYQGDGYLGIVAGLVVGGRVHDFGKRRSSWRVEAYV